MPESTSADIMRTLSFYMGQVLFVSVLGPSGKCDKGCSRLCALRLCPNASLAAGLHRYTLSAKRAVRASVIINIMVPSSSYSYSIINIPQMAISNFNQAHEIL